EKDVQSFATFDWDVDGDLDIALTTASGSVQLLRNDGGNLNNYLVVRLTGLRSGSGKNNVFGIGSRVEVKAGNLTQVQIVTKPVLHFGLGSNSAAEVVRVIWSNGVAQNLFNPEPRQTIVEDQILKGSCPWLYAWDGEKFNFVTDVLWSSALGMPLGIMSGEVGYASAASSNDGHKIPGEMLKAGSAGYELRFTSELWEAIYVERLELAAIDYPDSLEVYIDEGFRPGGSDAQTLHFVADKRYPVSAINERSEDVLPKLVQRDGNYVSDFFPGPQQGIMNLHELILDPGDLKDEQHVKLFLFGWVFPTDASLNFNMGQSAKHTAIPPSLEVVNAEGEWEMINGFIGFPKGKNKMMVVDLTGAFKSDDYRIRIRTNMQVYWDEAFFGLGDPNPARERYSLPLLSADLSYRGYSEVSRKDFYSPHIPDYEIVTTGQKWRDLTGNYTRYGNV
ncbi:MAG: ASPIC/UnbV domain-containing protein, partial [Calditrichota bacterium]